MFDLIWRHNISPITLSRNQLRSLYSYRASLAVYWRNRVSLQESPGILKILCLMFSGESVSSLQNRSYAAGITKREWKYLTAFAACFLTNMGEISYEPRSPSNWFMFKYDLLSKIFPILSRCFLCITTKRRWFRLDYLGWFFPFDCAHMWNGIHSG